ncbi:hypothetical protein D3C86_1838240 [compost metagenome]
MVSATTWVLTGSCATGASSIAICNVRIELPLETRSPSLIVTATTVPAPGLGTSIEALSDSSVSSGSSNATLSPGLTNTSITGRSLKSPMSGT